MSIDLARRTSIRDQIWGPFFGVNAPRESAATLPMATAARPLLHSTGSRCPAAVHRHKLLLSSCFRSHLEGLPYCSGAMVRNLGRSHAKRRNFKRPGHSRQEGSVGSSVGLRGHPPPAVGAEPDAAASCVRGEDGAGHAATWAEVGATRETRAVLASAFSLYATCRRPGCSWQLPTPVTLPTIFRFGFLAFSLVHGRGKLGACLTTFPAKKLFRKHDRLFLVYPYQPASRAERTAVRSVTELLVFAPPLALLRPHLLSRDPPLPSPPVVE